MADLLESCDLKLKRANAHIQDLDATLAAYYGRKPYSTVPYVHPESGSAYHRFSLIEDADPWWSLLVGDAIHNLRSALDHLLCALVKLNKSKIGTGNDFPIASSEVRFKQIVDGKIQGTRKKDVHKIVETIEPYQGGKGAWLWQLHELDIADKHRRLLLSFAVLLVHRAAPQVISLSEGGIVHVNQTSSRLVNDGDIIPYPIGKGDDESETIFLIAFNEPGILEGEPVIPALVRFHKQVEGIIEEFGSAFPRLRRQ